MRVSIVLLILCTGILLFSVWQLSHIGQEYRSGEDSYANLEQYIAIPTDSAVPAASAAPTAPEESVPEKMVPLSAPTEPATDSIRWPVVDFEALQAVNPDIVGWIYIEGTKISYPIVQGKDNSYYLNHLFDGSVNSSGTIFLDAAASGDFSDVNNIIYGHHMKNETMFAGLLDYRQQEFYDEHPVALLLTPGKNYQVLLFSGYVTAPSGNAWETGFDSGSVQDWLAELMRKSCFTSNIAPIGTESVLTFSTCTYEYDNARFVLHGVMVEQPEE